MFLDDCGICLEGILETEDVASTLQCGDYTHRFHVQCLEAWFKEHTNCPKCRMEQSTYRVKTAATGQVSVRSIEPIPSCAVCFTNLDQPAQSIGRLPACEHEFCLQCILAWSEQSQTCPLCRKPYTAIVVKHDGTETDTIHVDGLPAGMEQSDDEDGGEAAIDSGYEDDDEHLRSGPERGRRRRSHSSDEDDMETRALREFEGHIQQRRRPRADAATLRAAYTGRSTGRQRLQALRYQHLQETTARRVATEAHRLAASGVWSPSSDEAPEHERKLETDADADQEGHTRPGPSVAARPLYRTRSARRPVVARGGMARASAKPRRTSLLMEAPPRPRSGDRRACPPQIMGDHLPGPFAGPSHVLGGGGEGNGSSRATSRSATAASSSKGETQTEDERRNCEDKEMIRSFLEMERTSHGSASVRMLPEGQRRREFTRKRTATSAASSGLGFSAKASSKGPHLEASSASSSAAPPSVRPSRKPTVGRPTRPASAKADLLPLILEARTIAHESASVVLLQAVRQKQIRNRDMDGIRKEVMRAVNATASAWRHEVQGRTGLDQIGEMARSYVNNMIAAQVYC